MRITHDPQADAMYIRFSEVEIEHSDEVETGVIFDYDADDRVVAIEILDVRKRVALPFTMQGERAIELLGRAKEA